MSAARARILLFAGIREAAGASEVTIPHPEGATAADLREAVALAIPTAAALVRASRVAVDRAFVPDPAPVPPGAEIALIPPVSGG